MPVRRSVFICICVFAGLAVSARAATVTIGPDPCPAPTAAAAYSPEAWVVPPDARDGLWAGERSQPGFWPPEALAVEIPGGARRNGNIFVWFDRYAFEPAPGSGGGAHGCGALPAAPR